MRKLAPLALTSLLLLTGIASANEAGKAAPAAEQKATKDIVDTAVAAGNFTTLAKALEAADLIKTLKGKGPFTVFAPTDAAFAKLPAGTVEGLLKDVPKLKAILLYHVVPGKIPASKVVKLKEAKTAGGAKVKIDASAGVKINDATVTTPDVQASNGIIHIIDTVLLPPEKAAAK